MKSALSRSTCPSRATNPFLFTSFADPALQLLSFHIVAKTPEGAGWCSSPPKVLLEISHRTLPSGRDHRFHALVQASVSLPAPSLQPSLLLPSRTTVSCSPLVYPEPVTDRRRATFLPSLFYATLYLRTFSMSSGPHILIVDDEEGIRESLSSILSEEGYRVESAPSAEQALERATRGDLEVVLLDVWLPGMDGLEALSRLQALPRPPAVIMISGHGTIETAVRATKLGAFDFVEKPLTLQKIIVLVRNAVQQRRLEDENQLLRSELGHRYQVVGESVPMKALRQQIAVTAPTNGRVLIYGESGTGKELVARALHAASLRSKGPFVEVNCAAIPEELIESELFGHLKGSFTGASEDKIGKFQKADGGTLFLDEVGDMSLRTQSKVLRVLEEQRLEPVGSNQTVRVDVRVIAATNKDLEKEIAQGRFRQDLFYRLNVIPFFVPPLRDRKEDIPILARHFLNEFSSAYGKRTRELSDTAMEILIRYPWPGNVRELRNLVERLVIVCPQARIEPHHLPPELFRGVSESPLQPYGTLHEARSAYEREFILRKLQENRWNMTQTAAALGLERSHLYRKMKSLGIAAPD